MKIPIKNMQIRPHTWFHLKRYKFQDFAESISPLLLIFDGILDTFDLDSDHGEHLHGDSVKLVKTSPGSRLS